MSKRIARDRPRTPEPPNSLARLLDTPYLARAVPHLAPEMLHQLIRHRGLNACGDIVAIATPAQLTSIFDLDLWHKTRSSGDELFDVERFGEWLDLLADAGDAVAARTVAAMEDRLLIAGLSRYIRVFDSATIATTLDGEPLDVDVMAQRGSECEVGGYLVRGIRADAWDAIIALLLGLEADHPERFHAVMGECRRLSNSRPEVDGLDDLLMEPEQLLHDVAMDREQRRSQLGYSTPADARAFLQMARQRRPPANGEPSVNPLVAAYFRAANDTTEPTLAPSSTLGAAPETPDAVVDMLFKAGLVPERPRALLDGMLAQPSRLALIQRLIEYVCDNDDAIYVARSQELAFLANTLVAGSSIQSRSLTPQEASDAAVGICNLALEHWPARWPEPVAASTAHLEMALTDAFLMNHDLVSTFEVGWAVLYEDVTMLVSEQLVLALATLQCSDADIQEALDTLRIELTKQRDAGTPWNARDALDAIAMLDMPAWATLIGLLDECPVMPAALTATLDGQVGAVSATEFEFISTRRQLGLVREFMTRFPDIVAR